MITHQIKYAVIFCYTLAILSCSFGQTDFRCGAATYRCGELEPVGSVQLNPYDCGIFYKCVENYGYLRWRQYVCPPGFIAIEGGVCMEGECERTPLPIYPFPTCTEPGEVRLFDPDDCGGYYYICVVCEHGTRNVTVGLCPPGQFVNVNTGLCGPECILTKAPPIIEPPIIEPPFIEPPIIEPPIIEPPIIEPPPPPPPYIFDCEELVESTKLNRWPIKNNCDRFLECKYDKLTDQWYTIYGYCPAGSNFSPAFGACFMGHCKQ